MNPEKIGRYEIKCELGRGGMATVYEAYDPRFEREVAVKVLPREMLHDPQFRTRFEREAKTIAMLEHPAIVPVYDFGEESGQPYFVMRYMMGGSLSDRLRNGPLSIQEAARILSRLAPALDSAHSKGIIHRDLKPGNILFDKDGEPYISDFGIAKLTETQGSLSMTGSGIVGTPAYMSPEQGQGEKIDGRSDIYGLGVILFEMLTGRQPFQGDTPMSVVIKHITDPVPHILDVKPDLPDGVEKIVAKVLAKDRNERFSTSQQLADALNSISRGETPEIGQAPTASQMELPKTILSPKPVAKTKIQTKKPVVEVTRVSRSDELATPPPPRKRIGLWLGLGVGVPVLLVFLVGGFFLLRNLIPFGNTPKPTATQEVMVKPPDPTKTVTQTRTTEPPTPTPTSTDTVVPTPQLVTVGGTDMIAMINANNVWILRPDGSDLVQLTTDGADKFSLQWAPDGQSIFYISGKCIGEVSIAGETRNLACFNYSEYLEDFSISPDGAQMAIALDRVLYVVPFDLVKLEGSKNHNDVINMNGCLTYDNLAARGARWSADSKKIAIKVIIPEDNRRVDAVRIVDISNCASIQLYGLDTFPAVRFTMSGYKDVPLIPSYDWDGERLFLLNSQVRNEVYGYLYAYNTETYTADLLDPLKTGCCYTGALWSEDGSHVFFSYQNMTLGANSKNLLYFVPYGMMNTGAAFTPIPLPDGFLAKAGDHPEAALRPVK